MITKPLPFSEAIGFLLGKEQLPADWDASMWQEQETDFRTKAFWSANVENAQFLDRAQTLLFDYMAKVRETIVQPDGTTETALSVSDRSHFVKRMRDFMIAEGMAGTEEFQRVHQKDVTDIRSLARLNLIFDTTVRQSYGYGQWKQGMTPAALKAFPAARLIRERGVKEPRPRHQAHLGEVRLKTDPWWADYINARIIGGFEVPWGPYGFGSGVDQEDVSRREALSLGLQVDTGTEGMSKKITDGTEASTKKMDPALKQRLLDELRKGVAPRDPKEAARRAAEEVRRETLKRGLAEAIARGDERAEERYRKAFAKLPNRGLTVIDQGDSIRIAEDLGERLSKIRKREGMATAKQEREIARKIFERVDRRTAEPKTRENSQKGADRSRYLTAGELTLTPEEKRILESPHEILIVHTANGRLKSASLGNAQTSTIPKDAPVDAIISHNHPRGLGPSDSDIAETLRNPERIMRILGINETGSSELFQLKAGAVLSEDEILAIRDLYHEAAVGGGDTHQARREALELIVEVFPDILSIVSRIFP